MSAALLTCLALAASGTVAAQEVPDVTIESAPRWAQGPVGAWAPYVVTVHNDGAREIEGEVVLRPSPQPPPGPLDQFTQPAVVAFGGIAGPGGSIGDPGAPETLTPAPPVWPSHRQQVSVAGGGTKQLSVLVLEAPFGYTAELRDGTGRMIASEPPGTVPVGRDRWSVAVLTSAAMDEAVRPATSTVFTDGLAVVGVGSAGGLPEDPLLYSGLQAIVLSDFDTAALTAAQVRALDDFVGLGGNLVLGTGLSWARTLASLPDHLVPLRPSATSNASAQALAPIADVLATEAEAADPRNSRTPEFTPRALAAARATAEAAASTSIPVAVGELRHGRVVVQSAEGQPLVVVSGYGSGHVVQAMFDPFADVFGSRAELAVLGLQASLSPALSLLGSGANAVGGGVLADQLWSPVGYAPTTPLRSDWPRWPMWNVGLLALWVLAAGPVGYGIWRGRRRTVTWSAIPVLAVVLAGCGVAAASDGGRRADPTQLDNVVEVRRYGTAGTALVARFHGSASASNTPLRTDLPSGTSGSSAISQPDVGEPGSAAASAFAQPMAERIQKRTVDLVAALAGGVEVVVDGDGSSQLRSAPAPPGSIRGAQTLAVERDGGGLGIDLRGSEMIPRSIFNRPGGGTIRGSVTNLGRTRLGNVRIFANGARATIAAELAPGETVPVDVVLGDRTRFDVRSQVDLVMEAAGQFHPPGPDQAVIVATTEPRPGSRPTTGNRLSLVVQAFSLPGLEGPNR